MPLARSLTLGSVTSVAPASKFLSTFQTVESPLSGALLQGARDGGGNFRNMYVPSVGQCYGDQPNDGPYDDGLAIWNVAANSSHYAEGVVRKAPGYSAFNSQELLLVGMASLTASTVALYECLMECEASTIQFNRWDGVYSYTLDGFQTTISGSPGGLGQLADLDRVRMTTSLNGTFPRFTFTKNGGAAFWVCEDQTVGRIQSGRPGFGYFYRSLSPSGNVPGSYCWREIELG